MKLVITVFAMSGLLAIIPTTSSACSQTSISAAQERAREDRLLSRANVAYRAVVSNVGRDSRGGLTMTFRRTETLWGRGATESVRIDHYYFAVCPLGNLWTREETDIRDGLGVTIIGEAAYANDNGIPGMFVLVDGDPDTARVLRRFQALKQTP